MWAQGQDVSKIDGIVGGPRERREQIEDNPVPLHHEVIEGAAETVPSAPVIEHMPPVHVATTVAAPGYVPAGLAPAITHAALAPVFHAASLQERTADVPVHQPQNDIVNAVQFTPQKRAYSAEQTGYHCTTCCNL